MTKRVKDAAEGAAKAIEEAGREKSPSGDG